MRIATRRAAGLHAGGWTGELRNQVEDYFNGIAGEWHTRTSPQRTAVVMDALARGLGAVDVPVGVAVEVGSGIGTYSNLLSDALRRSWQSTSRCQCLGWRRSNPPNGYKPTVPGSRYAIHRQRQSS